MIPMAVDLGDRDVAAWIQDAVRVLSGGPD